MIPSELKIMPAARHFENDWVGAPHQTGGLSMQGVDCYGLVLLWYRDVLGVDIPDPFDHVEGQPTFHDAFRLMDPPEPKLVGDVVVPYTGDIIGHIGLISTNKAKVLQSFERKGVVIMRMGSPARIQFYRLKDRRA